MHLEEFFDYMDFGGEVFTRVVMGGDRLMCRAMLAGFEWQPKHCVRLFADVALNASSV